MSLMRSVLLAGAESVWLREKAMRRPFVRRSVSRFMPGETVDEALDACRRQQEQHGTGTILTHLGENLSSLAEADAVTADYLELIDRIASVTLDVQVSVKLTQLGLDLGLDACNRSLQQLVARAESRSNIVWMLGPDAPKGTFLGIGTHDARLVERLRSELAARGTDPSSYEFEMLYGIQRLLQARLVAERSPLRVLICYGEFWFPWYMRRLAERPANLLFVMECLLGG